MLSNYARLDGRKKLPVGGKKVEIILLVADDPVKFLKVSLVEAAWVESLSSGGTVTDGKGIFLSLGRE